MQRLNFEYENEIMGKKYAIEYTCGANPCRISFNISFVNFRKISGSTSFGILFSIARLTSLSIVSGSGTGSILSKLELSNCRLNN